MIENLQDSKFNADNGSNIEWEMKKDGEVGWLFKCHERMGEGRDGKHCTFDPQTQQSRD